MTLCRGVARRANSAAGCCTIALGSSHGAPRSSEGARAAGLVSAGGSGVRLEPQYFGASDQERASREEGKALTNFQRALPPPDSDLAEQILKDPYNFDFLTVREQAHEREVERGLLAHLVRLPQSLQLRSKTSRLSKSSLPTNTSANSGLTSRIDLLSTHD